MARIVVLDDVVDSVNVVKRILERKGHTVFGFTEEEDAIDFCKKNDVDLAILDIKLKRISGIEVLEEIRKNKPTIKAIMLTGYPTLQTAKEALVLGAREYCIKPIEKQELEQKVQGVLES
ncbi:MAG: response regulator [Thermodesulfovibrionales bacterium]|nr:response regulator [Thermodesulfovibrionales bacterium]